MGCGQSKATKVEDGRTAAASPTSSMPMSPVSSASLRSVSLPKEINKISDPGQRLLALLEMTLGRMNSDSVEDPLIWAKIVKICDKSPNAARYQHPKTGDTSLHLAARIISGTIFENMESRGQQNQVSPLDAMRVLIRCAADSVTLPNQKNQIPLHFVLCLPLNASLSAIEHQTEVINLLIASDYETSVEYLQRTDIVYNPTDGAATPLYHAVASIPDDFSDQSGPTLGYISAIHFPCPNMVSAKNDSNYDKPLALLYRRFSRQFDLSERFFPGDNSRKEVVEWRHKYKMAAMNTWKIILALLDPLLDRKKSVSDFYMVHAAVRMDCPPDLLRYIIETRPEEVRQTNEKGRLPLHVAAAATCDASSKGDRNGGISACAASRYHYKFVIDELLYSYPDGAASTDADDMLPLQLAVNSGKTWIGGGTKSLYDVYPDAMARVPVEEHPMIKKSLSFSTNFAEEKEEEKKKDNTGSGASAIVKEEHYDAIMMVQKPDAVLGDIISAMWANEEDGGVQMLGCVAITNIAKKLKKDEAKLLAMALTSVTTVVNAMKNHPNEPAVQEKGCVALRYLAPADNYREVSFAASGAASSIVNAMQAHVSDAIVQQEACIALRKIIQNGGPQRATVIASVSGFTALQNALGAHPNNVKVQKQACLALETLTSFPDANLPDLPGGQIAPLLEAAKQRHPAECKEIAETVLSRLS